MIDQPNSLENFIQVLYFLYFTQHRHKTEIPNLSSSKLKLLKKIHPESESRSSKTYPKALREETEPALRGTVQRIAVKEQLARSKSQVGPLLADPEQGNVRRRGPLSLEADCASESANDWNLRQSGMNRQKDKLHGRCLVSGRDGFGLDMGLWGSARHPAFRLPILFRIDPPRVDTPTMPLSTALFLLYPSPPLSMNATTLLDIRGKWNPRDFISP